MPAAVSAFIEGRPLSEVRQIQNDILGNYASDFSKHAPNSEVPRINLVWNSIPSQLGKENRKEECLDNIPLYAVESSLS